MKEQPIRKKEKEDDFILGEKLIKPFYFQILYFCLFRMILKTMGAPLKAL
jgi:hypothetical protein